MTKIHLGIIGYGGMGKAYATRIPDVVEIVAAADILPERIQEARDAGLAAYDSADALLADKNVNTVILSVPNHLHKEMAIKAARAGKHVISEKPAAINVAELDEMTAACKEAGVVFTAHHNRRWDKDMLTAKLALDDESLIGKVFTVESKLHSGHGYMHEWHLFKKYGGGMMYDWSVHLIDQALFMMPDAKVKRVFADLKYVLHDEVDDYFKILLKMDNEVTIHLEVSTYLMDSAPRWTVGGDKGTMVIKSFACDGGIYKTGKMLEKLPAMIAESVAGPTRQFAPIPPGGIVESPLPKVESDVKDFFRNVHEVINGKGELLVKIPEVRRVLAILEAAQKSSETGESIAFE